MSAVLTPVVLADKLYTAAEGARDPLRVALTALSTGVVSLGLPGLVLNLAMAWVAAVEDSVGEVRGTWDEICDNVPYLREHVNALIDWVDSPGPGDEQALRQCCDVLVDVDLHATMEAADGEILGVVYQSLLTDTAREECGAYYLPSRECFLHAYRANVAIQSVIKDPECGAGAMAVAIVREMRARGSHRWSTSLGFILNDRDPIALALAGINMAAYGMERVQLVNEDIFAELEGREVTAPKRGRRAS